MASQVITNIIGQAPKIPLGNSQYWERPISIEEIRSSLQDNNNEKKVMEGLKLLLAAMSRGRNVAELFPDVVKLVASQNTEVKKMVYIYLVHYAEVEPNASLLAINILKRNIEHSNQLIRAHALRTISSIRVKLIITVVVAAISKAVKDSSPYVRKTAAHAIPKVYSLDVTQKEVLIECIEKLLKDRSTMVLGSATYAFNEVCPDKWDLINPHFKKFCEVLADIDEWGQVSVLNMLTRYARTQFVDPDLPQEKPEEEEPKEEDDEYFKDFDFAGGGLSSLEPDHRLLLDSALPLLRSRNSAVVLSVASMYYYLAPSSEKNKVAKSMIRLVRGSREVQYAVFSSIVTMASTHPGMFQPYLSDFFIEGHDPSFVRKLKLEIMTQLANGSNIDRVLREFTYYTQQEDKEFVAQTIQSIGKCAMRLPDVTERCMMQLMHLLSSKSEAVVAESVVVIKQLLQMPPAEKTEDEDEEHENGNQHDDVIKQLTRLFDKVTNPKARASIIWVVGEYVDKVSAYAPDILRQLAKAFPTSDDVVKIQILNLASKLMLTNPEQTALIVQYILTLAKYDLNYDIRDKGRLLKFILLNPNGKMNILHENSKRLFITKKPSPNLGSTVDTKKFMIGSLSHLVNHTAAGYNPLPDWATEPADPELRKSAEPALPPPSSFTYPGYDTQPPASINRRQQDYDPDSLADFYGEEDYNEEYNEEYDEEQYNEEYNEEYNGDYNEEYHEEYNNTDYGENYNTDYSTEGYTGYDAYPNEEYGNDYTGYGDDYYDYSQGDGEDYTKQATTTPASTSLLGSNTAGALGDIFDFSQNLSSFNPVSSLVSNTFTLLKAVQAEGLQVQYTFDRTNRASLNGDGAVVSINLTFTNEGTHTLNNIHIETNESNSVVTPFDEISELLPGAIANRDMVVNFGHSVAQGVKFDIVTDISTFNVELKPHIGELMQPNILDADQFSEIQAKLGGQNTTKELKIGDDQTFDSIHNQILLNFNVALVSKDLKDNGFEYKYAATTLAEEKPVLIHISIDDQSKKGNLVTHSENAVFSSALASKIKSDVFGV